MTTIRYARFVLVDPDKGFIAWYESAATAAREQQRHGGQLFDLDLDDPQTIEQTLHAARQNMGVE